MHEGGVMRLVTTLVMIAILVVAPLEIMFVQAIVLDVVNPDYEREIRIAVYRDSQPTRYVLGWEELLDYYKFNWTEISQASLTRRALADYNVLVMPYMYKSYTWEDWTSEWEEIRKAVVSDGLSIFVCGYIPYSLSDPAYPANQAWLKALFGFEVTNGLVPAQSLRLRFVHPYSFFHGDHGSTTDINKTIVFDGTVLAYRVDGSDNINNVAWIMKTHASGGVAVYYDMPGFYYYQEMHRDDGYYVLRNQRKGAYIDVCVFTHSLLKMVGVTPTLTKFGHDMTLLLGLHDIQGGTLPSQTDRDLLDDFWENGYLLTLFVIPYHLERTVATWLSGLQSHGFEIGDHGWDHKVKDNNAVVQGTNGTMTLFGDVYDVAISQDGTQLLIDTDGDNSTWEITETAGKEFYIGSSYEWCYVREVSPTNASVAQMGLLAVSGAEKGHRITNFWQDSSTQRALFRQINDKFADYGFSPTSFAAPYYGFTHDTYAALTAENYLVDAEELYMLLPTYAKDNNGTLYEPLVQLGLGKSIRNMEIHDDLPFLAGIVGGTWAWHSYLGQWNGTAVLNKIKNYDVWSTTCTPYARFYRAYDQLNVKYYRTSNGYRVVLDYSHVLDTSQLVGLTFRLRETTFSSNSLFQGNKSHWGYVVPDDISKTELTIEIQRAASSVLWPLVFGIVVAVVLAVSFVGTRVARRRR